MNQNQIKIQGELNSDGTDGATYDVELRLPFGLRDLFAMSAMVGIGERGLWADVAARESYEYADAMMAEREKRRD